MNCPDCKTELIGLPKFCPKCGSRIKTPVESVLAVKYCPQCGTENPIGAKFCKSDGYSFEVKPTEESPASTAVPKRVISGTVIADNPVQATGAPTPLAQTTSPPQSAAAGPRPSVVTDTPSPAVQDSAGLPRAASSIAIEPTRVDVPNPVSKSYSMGLLIGIPTVLVVIAASMGGYKYWTEEKAGHKVPLANASSTQEPSVSVIQPDPRSAVANAASSNLAPQSAASKVDVARIQMELNQRLQREGFAGINASVNRDGSVNLDGAVASRKAKDEVVRLALSQYGVERVNEAGLQVISTAERIYSPPPTPNVAQRRAPSSSPAPPVRIPDSPRLEREVNRFLRGGG